MTQPSDPKRHPGQDICGALLTISEDFHQLLRSSCPRCTTGTGPCGVELIRLALALEDAIAHTPEEPAERAQLTRH
jgi:hypothetical protein